MKDITTTTIRVDKEKYKMIREYAHISEISINEALNEFIDTNLEKVSQFINYQKSKEVEKDKQLELL